MKKNNARRSNLIDEVFNSFIILFFAFAFIILTQQAEATDVPFSIIEIEHNFTAPGLVYAADVDGDGDLDAVLGGNPDIKWFENTNGDGSSWTGHDVALGYNAHGLYVADVDSDGDIDVLSATYATNKVSWIENTAGDGSAWAEHVLATSWSGASGVYAADMDGDGDTDIIGSARTANDIWWWENTGPNGDFSTYTQHVVDASFYGFSPYVADIDGDGDMDIVCGGSTHNDIGWWENNPSGNPPPADPITWTAHIIYASGFSWAAGVYAADLDMDGDLDVLGTAHDADDLTWRESSPSGAVPPADPITWTRHDINTDFDGAAWVDVADIDADGDPDVLCCAYQGDDIAWWENDGTPVDGGWTIHMVIEDTYDGAHGCELADVNGDGYIDVIGLAQFDNDVDWWDNLTIHRSEVFVDSGQSLGSLNSTAVVLGDVDEDGDLDAFVSNSTANELWLNDGTGTFSDSGQTLGSSSSYDVALGDVDKDGDLDVFVANYSGQANKIWLNDATGTFSDSGQSLGSSDSSGVALGDVDEDGDLDAFVTNSNGQADKVWLNDGTGTFSDSGQTLGSSDSSDVALGDVDGDDDLDAVVVNGNNQANTVWLNDGTGTFSDSGQTLGSSSSYDVALGDVDGDGDLDAFVTNYSGQANTVWLNDGSGTFSDSGQSLGSSDSLAVKLKDIDLDGDLDAFVANYSSQGNKVWLNDGSGTFSDSGQSLGSSDSEDADLGDVDSDGDLDVFVANYQANKVWLNRGGQFALPTSDTSPGLFLEGTTDDVLQIDVTHRGRSGDTDMELVTMELLFDDGAGTPLTNAQASALISNFYIYLDDGSGTYDGSDTLVATISTFDLESGTPGVQTITFTDQDPNVQVAYGTPKTYFVVIDLQADAKSQTPNSFRITHLTSSSSSGEDRDNGITLILEYAADVSASVEAADTVSNIAEARAASGDIQITGTVTIVSDYDGLDTYGHQFAVQDNSGTDGQSGIVILDTSSVISDSTNYSSGYTLSGLSGTRSAYHGMEQLTLTVDPGAPVLGSAPSPLPVTLPIADLDAIEAELIQINSLTTSATGTYAANTGYTYSDSVNTIEVRVEDGCEWVGDSIPTNAIDVIGIAWQYDSTDEILPRYDLDLPIDSWLLY